ncbi:MAG: ATP-dependent helicase [Ignavibacteriaceae bacterium]
MEQVIIQDKNRSPGFTIINVNYDALGDLVSLFQKENPSAPILNISDFMSDSTLPELLAESVILIQNLSSSSFQSNIRTILNNLISPLIAKKTKIFFISETDPFKIKNKIGFRELHYSPEKISSILLTHKCERLLKSRNALIDYTVPGEKKLPPEKIRLLSPLTFPLDSDLDIHQQEAVYQIEGPVRLLAPAGSGKTKTLINRIVYLINSGVEQNKILAVAFNKKAAHEMTLRLERINITNVNVRTLHSMGYEIVRKKWGFGFKEDEDENKYLPLIKEILNAHNINEKDYKHLIQSLAFLIGLHKNNFTAISGMKEKFRFMNFDYESLFFDLAENQISQGVITFDDMIYFAVYALITDRTLRENYQDKFDFVLVDEFQDVNNAQLFMSEILAMPQDNLFVVGDDDQMIYGWRGASNSHILDFPKNFPGCTEIILENNYRSAPSIVSRSRCLIEHNRIRVPKNIRGYRKQGDESVRLYKSDKFLKQAAAISDWILKLKEKENSSWNDFAVLFRYNILQFPLSLALRKKSIPHSPLDYSLLTRIPVARDIIDLLTLICKKEEENIILMRRILKKYVRKLSFNEIDKISSYNDLTKYAESDPGIRKFLADLRKAIKISRGILTRKQKIKRIFGIFDVMKEYGYKKSIRPANQDYEKDETVYEVIRDVLINSESLEEGFKFLTGDPGPDLPENPRVVKLSSIHKAKGLEFENVALYNYSDDLDTDTPEKLEEERRIFYVAATRAKSHFLLSAPSSAPASFIKEYFV